MASRRHRLTPLQLQWTVLLLLYLLLCACGGLEQPPTSLAPQHAPVLQVSQHADRSRAEALRGRTLQGKAYLYAAAPKGVREVHFYLDGRLLRRERQFPFDLMGGTLKRAKAFDTTTLSEGEHTLRATFRQKGGQRTQVQEVFRVGNVPPAPSPSEPSATRWQPKPGSSWQWQLQGDLDLSFDVDVYNIDLFDTPIGTVQALQARGVRVICYFSAGSFEPWRSDAAAFPEAVKGAKMDGWDELWLDIRALEQLAPIMRARLDLAAAKGCDGVEPDNVDAYSNRSGFALGAADQLRYNRFLAAEAHARGLAVGLKNDLAQVEELEPYFDFAVNEECFYYRECALLTPFVDAGKAVFGAEYNTSPDAFCPVTNALNLDFIKKRVQLDAYRVACR
jgi:hypothetical protein